MHWAKCADILQLVPAGQWGHPVVCVAVPLPICILILDSFPLPGVKMQRPLREWFNHSSVGCGHGGLGDGEEYLPGLLEKVLWHVALVALDSDVTATHSCGECSYAPRVGMLTHGSGSPHRRFLPQPFGCLCSSGPSQRWLSPWWWVATRASAALGGGSCCHWCGLEASSNHACQLSCWYSSVMYSSCQLVVEFTGGLAHTLPGTLVLPCPEISWSVDPRRVLTEGWSGATSSAMSACCALGVPSCVSFLLPPSHSYCIVE